MAKRRENRWQRKRRKAERRLRAKANVLRAKLRGRDRSAAGQRHRRMMQACASSRRRFPYLWAINW